MRFAPRARASASTPALPGTSKEGGKRGNNNQCNHNNDNICKKSSNNNNNNNKEQEYQCRCTAGVAISEVLVRHQLAKPSSASQPECASGNAPEAKTSLCTATRTFVWGQDGQRYLRALSGAIGGRLRRGGGWWPRWAWQRRLAGSILVVE